MECDRTVKCNAAYHIAILAHPCDKFAFIGLGEDFVIKPYERCIAHPVFTARLHIYVVFSRRIIIYLDECLLYESLKLTAKDDSCKLESDIIEVIVVIGVKHPHAEACHKRE